MFIKIVSKEYNVLFECTRVVEKENSITFLTGIQGDIVHTELLYNKEEGVRVFAMNDSGKTIGSWNIYSEGKGK